MGRNTMADSTESGVKTAGREVKEGASAAGSELKEGVTGDKPLHHAISDAGTEAKRASEDVSKDAERTAADAKREDRMKNGTMGDATKAAFEQAGPTSHARSTTLP